MGAAFVCASDHPTEHILKVLDENIVRNKQVDSRDSVDNGGSSGGGISDMGYLWGSDASDILALNNGCKYDFILASECLWLHEQVSLLYID